MESRFNCCAYIILDLSSIIKPLLQDPGNLPTEAFSGKKDGKPPAPQPSTLPPQPTFGVKPRVVLKITDGRRSKDPRLLKRAAKEEIYEKYGFKKCP